MVLYLHELKQGCKSFLVWTISILCFMEMCIFLFPDMKTQMEMFSKLFSALGVFTTAFGMDKVNFGSLLGFYAVECGNILSMGGAFYAAVLASNLLSKEEREHTAEFLLAHPKSRGQIQCSKLAALFTQLTGMHVLVFASSILSIWMIKETIAWKELAMLHLAYYLCQIELALICYAISAFRRSNNYGIGMGLALGLYFMSLLANISDKLKIFHILSPFGYAEGSDILAQGYLEGNLIALGLGIGVFFAILGAWHYQRKDIY